MKIPLTLRTIRNTKIAGIIQLLHTSNISQKQLRIILQIAILFLNNKNDDVRDFGYSLLIRYCIRTDDYIPLYDIAASLGYIPIMHLLENQALLPSRESFLKLLMESYREHFKNNEVYQTENQRELFLAFEENIKTTLAVIAPTSYGKSELIEQTILNQESVNIAVVVPSKALISQTRRRIIGILPDGSNRQIIIHHDTSFDPNRSVVAVMTQERLLRTLQKYTSFAFDIMFVDEAHNLLSGDKRSRLLGSAIMINQLRNEQTAIKYLTPFLISADSLRLIHDKQDIKQIKITEKLKTEAYYICDIFKNNRLRIYDQFLNDFIIFDEKKYLDEFEILHDRKKSKNIVYLNKPKSIEQLAELLTQKFATSVSPSLEKVCNEISEYVHPQYRILKCLRTGVAYHHGAVPDIVRAYIESAFKKESSINWIVTSSTLLEGVNIPVQALFILDPSKGRSNLSAPQFRNLVGRVNRFSEIFHSEDGSPNLLVPEIYLIKCRFSRSNSNFEDYIKNVAKVDKRIEDELENPLLAGGIETDLKTKQRDDDFTYIENIEPGAVLRDNPKRALTEVGRLCYIHNIYEVDIASHEISMDADLSILLLDGKKITDARELLATIASLFISRLSETGDKDYTNLLRLKNDAACAFYSMFFDWRINQVNYGRMIANFIAYWKKILQSGGDSAVYVGRWGTISREGEFIENYVDLKTQTDYELINLAIVRIKEEQDFLDNSLVKFLEVLNELNLVESDLYNKIKYGTTDETQMALIRAGLSHIAASVLTNKYKKFLTIRNKFEILISQEIREAFRGKKEKDLITFEVETSGLIREI